MTIDIQFDFRSDTPPARDPDSHSPTLRRYHQILWSKPLPDGRRLDLLDSTAGVYLHHLPDAVGELQLASDAVMQTYVRWVKMQSLVHQMTASENDEFMTASYTIGGMLVWPGNRIGRSMTINAARGFMAAIADRIDLTVECIRRHYIGDDDTPLGSVLRRYADYFALFDDFAGFIDFFHLQDLVGHGRVRFFTDFDGFTGSGCPKDISEYRQFRSRSLEFIHSRNSRIAALGL